MTVIEKVQFSSYRTKEDISAIQEAYDILTRVKEDTDILLEMPGLLDIQDITTLLLGTVFTKFPRLRAQEILGAKYLSERYVALVPYRNALPTVGEYYNRWDILMEADCAMIRSIARKESDHPMYRDATRELARRYYWEVVHSSLYKDNIARFALDGFEMIWPILDDFHREQSKPYLVSV